MYFQFIFMAVVMFVYMPVHSAYAQCSVNFGTTAAQLSFSTYAGDIVHAVSGEMIYSDSFDVWQDDSLRVVSCSGSGGLPDFSIQLTILPTFDVYGGQVIDSLAGVRHDVVQSTGGLRGGLPFNNSGVSESSSGDVRGYTIKVLFAPHVNVRASDFSVNFTSGNTDARIFESCVVEFLDSTYRPYAPAVYKGFYDSAAPSRIDTACPGGFLDSAGYIKRDAPWRWTGNGTFAAQSTETVDIGDVCHPLNGVKGSDDDKQVNPITHAGLSQYHRIGGFIFTVYAEDVAGGQSDSGISSSKTSINTLVTSTLTGFTISGSLPVTWMYFNIENKEDFPHLTWATASEHQNSHFEIEKYTKGAGFEKIAEVPGAGNSMEVRHYEFPDHNRCDVSPCYYRLKQVDFDGRFEYSAVKSYWEQDKSEGSIFPNPLRDHGQISVNRKVKSALIFSANGRMVRDLGRLNSGCCTTLDMSGLISGLYVLKLEFEQGDIKLYRFHVCRE